jgi:hypothetical protein
LRGTFGLVAGGPRGVRRLAGWCPNIITDLGMNRMGTNTGDLCTHIHVGSGTAPSSTSDTQMQDLVAFTSSNSPVGAQNIEMDESPFYVDRVVAKRFYAGFVTEPTELSEVGIGWAIDGLFARSRIRDSAREPTSVTVLPDEYLDVFYLIRVDPPLGDGTLSFSTGTAHTGAVRASVLPTNISAGHGFDTKSDGSGFLGYIYGPGASLGPLTGSPTGAALTQGISAGNGWSAYKRDYVANSFERTVRYVASPSAGNLAGGLSALRAHTTLGFFQFVWDPVIGKSSDSTMYLDVTFRWDRSSWND